jgi:hypothetical protein
MMGLLAFCRNSRSPAIASVQLLSPVVGRVGATDATISWEQNFLHNDRIRLRVLSVSQQAQRSQRCHLLPVGFVLCLRLVLSPAMRAFSTAVSLLVCAVLRPADAQYEDLAPECAPTDSYVRRASACPSPSRHERERPTLGPYRSLPTCWCVPVQLNNVMEVVQQQAIMLEDQAGLFDRMVGNGTLSTTSELMLSTDYWQALGTSFVDMVRALGVLIWSSCAQSFA